MHPALVKLGAYLLLAGAGLFFASTSRAAVVERGTYARPAECVPDQAPSGTCYNLINPIYSGFGCTNNQYNTSYTWPSYYDPPSYVQPPWTCVKHANNVITDIWRAASQCPNDNSPQTGTIARTGANANSPPQQVCFETCTYTLDRATNVVAPDGSPQWLGTWRRDGGTCASEQTPTPPPDTSPTVPDAEKTDNAFDSVRKDLTSTVGPMLGFPNLPFFTAPVVRVCSLTVPVPEYVGAGPSFTVDLCPHLEKIDSIGGWFLYFLTALGLWGLFVARAPE